MILSETGPVEFFPFLNQPVEVKGGYVDLKNEFELDLFIASVFYEPHLDTKQGCVELNDLIAKEFRKIGSPTLKKDLLQPQFYLSLCSWHMDKLDNVKDLPHSPGLGAVELKLHLPLICIHLNALILRFRHYLMCRPVDGRSIVSCQRIFKETIAYFFKHRDPMEAQLVGNLFRRIREQRITMYREEWE